jgi:xylulose-5-phosphate/fructose-6-phosphate phosphoketolase
VPSHVSPPTPGSIHEGGELGYVLSHAFGAAFDNPDLVVVAVVGDGEAETGPLAGSWQGISFLNPAATGRCCRSSTSTATRSPGRPCSAARAPSARRSQPARGHGYEVHFVVGGESRCRCTRLRRELDACYAEIRAIQAAARAPGAAPIGAAALADDRAAHPEGLDRAGWSTGCDRGTFRAHQVPLSGVREQPRAPGAARGVAAQLSARGAVRRAGRLAARWPRWRPTAQADGRDPHANGGKLLVPARAAADTAYAVEVPAPGGVLLESTRALGERCCARSTSRNADAGELPAVLPRRDQLEPAGRGVRGGDRCLVAPTLPSTITWRRTAG